MPLKKSCFDQSMRFAFLEKWSAGQTESQISCGDGIRCKRWRDWAKYSDPCGAKSVSMAGKAGPSFQLYWPRAPFWRFYFRLCSLPHVGHAVTQFVLRQTVSAAGRCLCSLLLRLSVIYVLLLIIITWLLFVVQSWVCEMNFINLVSGHLIYIKCYMFVVIVIICYKKSQS